MDLQLRLRLYVLGVAVVPPLVYWFLILGGGFGLPWPFERSQTGPIPSSPEELAFYLVGAIGYGIGVYWMWRFADLASE